MSQHDMDIADQAVSTAFPDVTAALKALASNSSGATEPATTYAYQWWYDTTANILKQRNGADSAWLDAFTLVGGVLVPTNGAVAADLVGQQTIAMPANAITPTATNGAEFVTEELVTNDVMLAYLAFDDSAEEYGCFGIQMPKGWNGGTLVAQFVWKCGVTTGNVIWGIRTVAVGNDDPLDVAFGTAVEVTDGAGSAADDCMISAETATMTVAGSPAAEEYVVFKVYRKAADGSDTLVGDAELLSIKIHYTTDAATDS